MGLWARVCAYLPAPAPLYAYTGASMAPCMPSQHTPPAPPHTRQPRDSKEPSYSTCVDAQAATGSSQTEAGSWSEGPSQGDGLTYEMYEDKQELWVDFIADTGEGGRG